MARAKLLVWGDFRPGAVMGRASERLDDTVLALWRELYPWDTAEPGALPAGLSTVLVMRAYAKVLAPRPPGNIHARQRLELAALPRVGEEVTTEIVCAGKELRKDRRYVDVETRSTGSDGRALFAGAMRLIWAR